MSPHLTGSLQIPTSKAAVSLCFLKCSCWVWAAAAVSSVLRSCVCLWKAHVFSSWRPGETLCKSGAGSWWGACCAVRAVWSPGPSPGTPSTRLLEGAQPGAVRHTMEVSRARASRSSHFPVQINQFSCSRILFPGWEYCGPNGSSPRSPQDLNAVLWSTDGRKCRLHITRAQSPFSGSSCGGTQGPWKAKVARVVSSCWQTEQACE